MSNTLLEAVRGSLECAARYNRGDVVAPVAVQWTDADSQWQPVVEQLRGFMSTVHGTGVGLQNQLHSLIENSIDGTDSLPCCFNKDESRQFQMDSYRCVAKSRDRPHGDRSRGARI